MPSYLKTPPSAVLSSPKSAHELSSVQSAADLSPSYECESPVFDDQKYNTVKAKRTVEFSEKQQQQQQYFTAARRQQQHQQHRNFSTNDVRADATPRTLQRMRSHLGQPLQEDKSLGVVHSVPRYIGVTRRTGQICSTFISLCNLISNQMLPWAAQIMIDFFLKCVFIVSLFWVIIDFSTFIDAIMSRSDSYLFKKLSYFVIIWSLLGL